MEEARTVLYGVGAVGSLIAKRLLEKEGLKVVGAIDIAEDKVGRDLGTIISLGTRVGLEVSNDVDAVLQETTPDIVVHATSSDFEKVFPQLTGIVKNGVNVVSTCEELSYPYRAEPHLAKQLDTLAKKAQATVLGTGINPGFLMDTLVIGLTAVCQKIEKIRAVRVMDAATRRMPFQRKIGAGLSVAAFRKAMEQGRITGHVGLEQSIAMVGAALAWTLEKIVVDQVEPVVTEKPVRSEAVEVKAGHVAGLRQVARGYRSGRAVITLDFQAYIGAKETYDAIQIDGIPPVNQKITPCVHGDQGTVAMVVNSIPKVINAQPGLVTMKDLPMPSAAVERITAYLQ
jgi:4-hydroxy-tetrahydrodipicolinate reductase